jgi:hypothetical protein
VIVVRDVEEKRKGRYCDKLIGDTNWPWATAKGVPERGNTSPEVP